ncbi:MAG TPA: DUF5906 domain-containing protein [Verrucomicrobiae bacterium]|nr:DUF5906 domain-containing protein [Verrucomicrobiae bacterium]
MSKVKLPEIFFALNGGSYFMELIPGKFVPLSSSDVKSHLQLQGHNTDLKNDEGLSHGNEIIAKAQIHKYVDYAGPLAGYEAGFYTMPGNKRVLVTDSVRPVKPGKSKKCPRIETFLGELFDNQGEYVLAWLKIALESLLRGNFMPGQLLVLAGPPGCGKTFFQWFVTQLLGGRSAKPYRYMTGQTQFNSDLAQAEHLPMGDVAASYDIRSRKNFASQIKEFCVEPEMSIHGKGKEAITLQTFRRLTLSVNDEPEHLLIIPPLDNDISDKIILTKCNHATLSEDRNENQAEFLGELPAFAAMLADWKIPKAIKDSRFGVRAFHHPDLLDVVEGSAPEHQLLSIIDEVLWANDTKEDVSFWKGSAEQLKVRLMNTPHASTISRLLYWPAACGTYLARLKQKMPKRFVATKSKGKTGWVIWKENNNAD